MVTNEYVIGAGYKIKDVEINISNLGGKARQFKSDINLRVDFSIRNSLTLIRKIEEGVTQPTAGQTTTTLKTSADYSISQNFILKIFFDRNINTPLVSTTFKSATTNFGISIRFTLTN